ncbi:hypothetical protein HanPSC8_Chr03g0090691 [Helianthus annuus]|nr:hypothetical protein HanPSC8_Chr03g0090691 [Helianthus annuus]
MAEIKSQPFKLTKITVVVAVLSSSGRFPSSPFISPTSPTVSYFHHVFPSCQLHFPITPRTRVSY